MKKLFIFIFILFSFVTQNLHAKDFFYEIYGLNLKFMEIQFSNSPHQELATKIKSKGLLNFLFLLKEMVQPKPMLNKLPISFNIKRKRRQDQLLLFLKIEKLSRTSPNLLEKNKQILFQFSPITYKMLSILLPL